MFLNMGNNVILFQLIYLSSKLLDQNMCVYVCNGAHITPPIYFHRSHKARISD